MPSSLWPFFAVCRFKKRRRQGKKSSCVLWGYTLGWMRERAFIWKQYIIRILHDTKCRCLISLYQKEQCVTRISCALLSHWPLANTAFFGASKSHFGSATIYLSALKNLTHINFYCNWGHTQHNETKQRLSPHTYGMNTPFQPSVIYFMCVCVWVGCCKRPSFQLMLWWLICATRYIYNYQMNKAPFYSPADTLAICLLWNCGLGYVLITCCSTSTAQFTNINNLRSCNSTNQRHVFGNR